MNINPADIDEYRSTLPDDIRERLDEWRRTVKMVAPDAVESISYGIPTFKYKGQPLIYFGAAKKHYAFYGTSKGTLRFPPDEPVSEDLVKTLVDERIKSIEAEMAERKGRKSA